MASPEPLAEFPEPTAAERWYHCILGGFFFTMENLKRLVFEFLPLTWLRTYRLFKSWLFSCDDSTRRISISEQARQHGITIGSSFLL